MAEVEAAVVLEDVGTDMTVVRLNRPARLNALTREMVNELNSVFDRIAQRPEVRVVILTGTGRGFCSGQDVAAADERNRTAPSGLVERLYWQEQFAGMVKRIRAMPQVVIAAVNGPCAGAGLALALASDIAASLPGSDRSLPLNAVTALIGAPLVIRVLLRHRRGRT